MLVLDIGYFCNNNCVFCYLRNGGDSKIDLPYKSFDDIQKELAVARSTGEENVLLLGAESTLRDDFVDIIKTAKELKFTEIGTISNGRRLSNKDLTERIVDAGLTSICISLAGATAKTHDYLTGQPGSFKETMAGIENIASLDKAELAIKLSFVINKINYAELPKIFKIATANRIKEVNVIYASPKGGAISNKSFQDITMPLPLLGSIIGQMLSDEKTMSGFPKKDLSLIEFPFCSLPSELRSHVGACDHLLDKMMRIPLCDSCPHADICPGLLRAYCKIHGEKGFKL